MRRALLWVWVAGCAFAQGDLGRIGGTVFDATGAVIPGAKVSAKQNATRVDGIENSAIIDASPGNLNGETSSGFRLQNSLEIIQEFRVESSNDPAEYGTGTGGQIMIVTKSGGNALHGAMFETARNFFDGAKKSRLNRGCSAHRHRRPRSERWSGR